MIWRGGVLRNGVPDDRLNAYWRKYCAATESSRPHRTRPANGVRLNSPQAIYKWQNGAALPTVDNLIVLAALLHVRIDDILITDDAVA